MRPDPPETALDTRTKVARSEVRRLEVMGQMTGRRRFWSVDQKLAILAAADQSDNTAALARRYDIRTSLIYTWRRELRYARQAVARQVSSDAEQALVPVIADSGAAATDRPVVIEVEFSGTVTRIYAGADAGLVATVLKSLRVLP
jgi:transposase